MFTLSKQGITRGVIAILALAGLGTYTRSAQAITQWEDYKAKMVYYYTSEYAQIDNSVRYSKEVQEKDGKKVLHWTINFNPTQERWNHPKRVLFLPKEAKPTTIKMGVWDQQHVNNTWTGHYRENATKDYNTEDLLKEVHHESEPRTETYAVSFETQRANFESLWSSTIQQTQEGDSLSNFNAIKDQGRFGLAVVQHSNDHLVNLIFRWEFDTPLENEVDAENTPFIVGTIIENGYYPRFLGEMEREKLTLNTRNKHFWQDSHYHLKNANDNFVWKKRWGTITPQVKEQVLNKVEIENGYVPLDLFSLQEEANQTPVLVLPEAIKETEKTNATPTLFDTHPDLRSKAKFYDSSIFWRLFRR
ncbi:hypothetical protein [Streptococcus halichoeri]|uniref:hypothetical protein n=1 Tax=Streptococcus halichoeri TaxID=254785 RepID=UPI001357B725|nr:hypothetical protein [Streptococcus halichoeri]